MAKVPTVVAIADKKNEMYKAAKAVMPVANWMESWGDMAPQTGALSYTHRDVYKRQRLIPLHQNQRQMLQLLLTQIQFRQLKRLKKSR